jgi:hypothetical protein
LPKVNKHFERQSIKIDDNVDKHFKRQSIKIDEPGQIGNNGGARVVKG